MAGQPRLNALVSAIESAGGDDVIFDRIADGEFLTSVAEDWDVSSQLLRKWIRLDPERVKRYDAAKHASADALVEDAGEILDKASTLSSQHIAKEKSRAEFKKWLATRRDREQYGDDAAQVNVNLNLGQLHLDTLRHKGRVIELPPEDVEYDELDSSEEHGAGQGVLPAAPDGERAEESVS